MVKNDIEGRAISDPAVLRAMLKVPRHLFAGSKNIDVAYSDSALPIKENQTISQPYVVALMTATAELTSTDKVLEIGTGSGYQAAVLGEIVKEVYSIEIIETLARESSKLLHELGYKNIKVKHGDGYQGWKEESPFDAILITAAAPKIPEPLTDQLKTGGRLVMPLGETRTSQELIVLTKTENGLDKRFVTRVVFVPMTGEVRNPKGEDS
ncbi:MAG TPA: protein-L-isoaspartate O-methyltransferase [Nitrospina sp.]|jgi:protein-L-isoaspartate(D-aspartate) O-methyltransferase|nr:protein-L-isoaspartate O-methyltransferase [Nitrospina sp.]|tara:strand:+ start:719 stop:1348 length:630 start_codon:yes stop_codon:yes gene_type:complete